MPTPTPIPSPLPPPPAHPHPSLSLPRCDCKDVRVSSANCKRAVCKMQACRLQIARVSFAICKPAVFRKKSFPIQIFSFLFYANCKACSANCKRALCKLHSCPVFVKALPSFSPRITHPRVAKGCQGLPRVGSGCQGLAELPRFAEGWQGLPRVEGRSKGWQGLSRAVSGVAHHDGHTYQPLASLRLSAAVRKRKERNSLEAEARRIANVDSV